MSHSISEETRRRLGLGLTAMPSHSNRHRRDTRALRYLITALLILAILTGITFLKP